MEPAEPQPRRTAISCLPSCICFMDSHPKSDEEPERTCFFTYKELRKATRQFQQEIGSGGYGSVYLGELQGKGTVAVKVLRERTKKSIEQFNNEVEILSRLRHPNLVVFYGSTKPQEELLLVYEFVPNYTLGYHLHSWRRPLSWSLRMQIAIEIADGLSYLHSLPIIHRDVKTDNILLDDKFHVKIADFGLCRLLSLDDTDVLTMTPGTMGYRDPEFDRVIKVSDKNDVYSFGVVLLELISRQKAVDVHRGPDRIYLDEIGLNMIKNGELKGLVDPNVRYSHRDVKGIIDMVADLAYKCLQPTGDQRPPILEVLKVLKDINNQMQELNVFEEIKEEKETGLFKGWSCDGGRATFTASSSEEIKEEKETDSSNGSVIYEYLSDDAAEGEMEFESFSVRIFSYEELKEATDSFNPSRLLDKDGSGRTYRGRLRDGRTVAVTEVFDVNLSRLGQLFNKVTAGNYYRHENLVTIYGCAFPRDEKLLVVSGLALFDNLADHLHEDQTRFNRAVRMQAAIHEDQTRINWAVRMQAAIQTAKALAYLHALHPPVIHCDVKSSNILFDYYFFDVKLTGFKMCDILPSGTTSVLSLQPGTVGYRDPEYDRTLTLSNKSDVYSFGVVLAELISGHKAVDVNREIDQIYLDCMFLNKITNNKLDEFVDPRLKYHLDNNVRMMINSVSELARQCLQPKGYDRPSIAEVLNVLKGIEKKGQPSAQGFHHGGVLMRAIR